MFPNIGCSDRKTIQEHTDDLNLKLKQIFAFYWCIFDVTIVQKNKQDKKNRQVTKGILAEVRF